MWTYILCNWLGTISCFTRLFTLQEQMANMWPDGSMFFNFPFSALTKTDCWTPFQLSPPVTLAACLATCLKGQLPATCCSAGGAAESGSVQEPRLSWSKRPHLWDNTCRINADDPMILAITENLAAYQNVFRFNPISTFTSIKLNVRWLHDGIQPRNPATD